MSVAASGSTGSLWEVSDYEDCLDAFGAGTNAGTCHAMRVDQLDAEIDRAVLERQAQLDEIATDDTVADAVRQAAAAARSDLPDAVSAFRTLRERTCWDLLGPQSMPLAEDANTGRCEVAVTEAYLDTIS